MKIWFLLFIRTCAYFSFLMFRVCLGHSIREFCIHLPAVGRTGIHSLVAAFDRMRCLMLKSYCGATRSCRLGLFSVRVRTTVATYETDITTRTPGLSFVSRCAAMRPPREFSVRLEASTISTRRAFCSVYLIKNTFQILSFSLLFSSS